MFDDAPGLRAFFSPLDLIQLTSGPAEMEAMLEGWKAKSLVTWSRVLSLESWSLVPGEMTGSMVGKCLVKWLVKWLVNGWWNDWCNGWTINCGPTASRTGQQDEIVTISTACIWVMRVNGCQLSQHSFTEGVTTGLTQVRSGVDDHPRRVPSVGESWTEIQWSFTPSKSLGSWWSSTVSYWLSLIIDLMLTPD